MQSNARTPPPGRARSFSFPLAHPPSTCSRVTRTAATNFAPWFKPCLNEKEVQNAKPATVQTKETACHRGERAAPHRRSRRRLRRFGRAEYETLARAVD